MTANALAERMRGRPLLRWGGTMFVATRDDGSVIWKTLATDERNAEALAGEHGGQDVIRCKGQVTLAPIPAIRQPEDVNA